MWLSSCPSTIVEKNILSSLDGFGTFVKTQLTIDVWVYFWTLNYTPLVSMSVLAMCHHHIVLITIAFFRIIFLS